MTVIPDFCLHFILYFTTFIHHHVTSVTKEKSERDYVIKFITLLCNFVQELNSISNRKILN